MRVSIEIKTDERTETLIALVELLRELVLVLKEEYGAEEPLNKLELGVVGSGVLKLKVHRPKET